MHCNYTKSLIILALCLLTHSVSHAQFDAFSCNAAKNISKADGLQLMQKTQSWYSALKSLSGEFTQNSYLAAMDMAENSAGNFWFKKKGKMRWMYLTPEPQDFIVHENTYWLYRPEDRQVLVDGFRSILISDLPIAFLMGIGNLPNDFNFIEGCKNTEGNVLKLATKKKDGQSEEEKNELNTFALLVSNTGQTLAAQVEDVSGNITTILLSANKLNQEIADEKFEPNFPEGVDVYDRRTELSR